MGARWFEVMAEGTTAQEAFQKAVEDARTLHGYGGYTGSIACKITFAMAESPIRWESVESAEWREEMMDKFPDKWGPAGCLKMPDVPDTWLFFGWSPY